MVTQRRNRKGRPSQRGLGLRQNGLPQGKDTDGSFPVSRVEKDRAALCEEKRGGKKERRRKRKREKGRPRQQLRHQAGAIAREEVKVPEERATTRAKVIARARRGGVKCTKGPSIRMRQPTGIKFVEEQYLWRSYYSLIYEH